MFKEIISVPATKNITTAAVDVAATVGGFVLAQGINTLPLPAQVGEFMETPVGKIAGFATGVALAASGKRGNTIGRVVSNAGVGIAAYYGKELVKVAAEKIPFSKTVSLETGKATGLGNIQAFLTASPAFGYPTREGNALGNPYLEEFSSYAEPTANMLA